MRAVAIIEARKKSLQCALTSPFEVAAVIVVLGRARVCDCARTEECLNTQVPWGEVALEAKDIRRQIVMINQQLIRKQRRGKYTVSITHRVYTICHVKSEEFRFIVRGQLLLGRGVSYKALRVRQPVRLL